MLLGKLMPSLALALGTALAVSLVQASTDPAPASAQPAAGANAYGPGTSVNTKTTADHGKFKELQQDFKSGPEVTKACLACHTEAAKQVHHSKHWTWEFTNPQNNQLLGKKHVINNFCTSIKSNEAFCNACHAGYGWKDDSFDFTSQENVDCLVCHERTGTYRKLPGLAGHPPYEDMEFPPKSGKIVKAPILKDVAQSVGKTGRKNCGACHFFGGGGDAVKHGDLDSSLTMPSKYLDVHMDKDGLNFSCGDCHKTTGHEVPGSRYTPTASDDKAGNHMRGKEDKNPATCQACHGTTPHKKVAKLNSHTDKIACQTCHIPEYARGGKPTKMWWDWSTAGKLKDGKPFTVKDATGHDAYDSKKGDFKYETNVIPEYIWFNGKVNYTLRETKLDPTKVIKINSFEGSPDDSQSKIWPMKIFRGKQPYDIGNNQLVVFHTYGKDDSALWSNFNWDKAIEYGMKDLGAEFSGKFAFVETEMAWPITHMVAPKGDALSCAQCHAPSIGVGRLDKVPGIYMPGRTPNTLLDTAGWALAGLSLLGVIGHGAGRMFASRKKA
jgi:octaheme c-type cytochrome (tetrathionate reductase family)